MIDVAFVADMVLSFFAGFYNVLGEAVTDLKTIRWHYTHSFFILDFIACIPPEMSRRAERPFEATSGAACANSSSTTGGIPKVEQTAPLRHGAAAWAWGF